METAVLIGSEKQIAWATEIREKFATYSTQLAKDIQEGKRSWVHPRIRARFAEVIATVSANYLTTEKAAIWIQNKHLGTKAGVEALFVKIIKQDEQAKKLMAGRN